MRRPNKTPLGDEEEPTDLLNDGEPPRHLLRPRHSPRRRGGCGFGRYLIIHEATPGETILLDRASTATSLATSQIALGLASLGTASWRIIAFDVNSGHGFYHLDNNHPQVTALLPGLVSVPVYPRVVYFGRDFVHFQLVSDAHPPENPYIEYFVTDAPPYPYGDYALAPCTCATLRWSVVGTSATTWGQCSQAQ